MHHRRAWAEIIAAVLAGNRIDRVGPQFAALGGFSDRLPDLLLHGDLIHAYGRLNLKCREARILTDRTFVFVGHIDVLADNAKRLARLRGRVFSLNGQPHILPHVRWQVRPAQADHARVVVHLDDDGHEAGRLHDLVVVVVEHVQHRRARR